ncbi:hypothetical protein GTW25_05520 [Aliihoeflea aestuarii]|uniref:hypothetical protein n=1 Tax=Aliihoeflea aestuarii TaxID=453840 RepID=UPI0020940010|nr:hypothetical protein [Aliihoeflea aestuarii]MCO6390486.1 hypothetical protein [Aliihoeflea aestuarii]
MASERGDGLHPQLRTLLESRHKIETDERVVDLASNRPGSMIQAGPNPIALGNDFRPGNVVRFDGNDRQAVLDARPTHSMKGKV